MLSELRDYQQQAIQSLARSIGSGKKRPMLKLSTGAGKTVIASSIVERAQAKGNRVIFTVPAISLIDQTAAVFRREGITDIGVIQADHPDTNAAASVQIASAQTLMRRAIPETDLVIIDEAHRFFEFYKRWMNDPVHSRTPFIGLSATPWTKGLGKYFDDLVIGVTTQQLIDQGHLSPFEVFAPSKPDLSKVRTVAGDYHEGDLSEVMQDSDLVADVVSTWARLGNNEPTLCFGVDRAHAQAMRDQFTRAGVSAAYVDAHTSLEERDRIRDEFHAGEIKVVCNVGVLTTGVDWDVRCLILARPTKSIMLFEQIIGRALRTAPGKQVARILDHSDTHLRLGLVTNINKTELCTGKKAKSSSTEAEEPLPKECPKCSFLKPPKVRECPHCSFTPSVQSELEIAEGELQRISGKKRKPTAEEKLDWHQRLTGYAHMHGKNNKFVLAIFRQKFGEWPYSNTVPPLPPSDEINAYIKSRQIAYAKRKNKQRQPA